MLPKLYLCQEHMPPKWPLKNMAQRNPSEVSAILVEQYLTVPDI